MSSNTTPIRAAVIGYGMSAKIFQIPFLQALSQHFSVYGVVQRTPTAENNAEKDIPSIKTWTSSSEMIKDSNVDLVVVSSIPDAHFQQCKEALEAGKHVLCEKPFVPTSDEALQLANIAKANKRVLAVYQNRRWDSDFLTVQSLIQNGKLGRITEFESHFDRHRPQPPAASAATWNFKNHSAPGAIYNLGTHLLDQVVTLFGMPERITGFLTDQRVYTEEGTGGNAGGDSFTVLLHYDKRGLMATVKAAIISAREKQLRFLIRGDQGTFEKYGLDTQEEQLKAGSHKVGDKGYGVEAKEMNGTLTTVDASGAMKVAKVAPEEPPQTYIKLFEALAKAIRGDGPAPVTAEQAAETLKVIEIAKQSSEEGRAIKVA